MQTKAEGASGAGSAARIWQRGATRRAILDAARLVAARTDSTDFSLNTVAKEAGYSATTVFAYFSTKNDLFNAVVADDLAVLARQMRESYPFPAQKEPIAVEEPVVEDLTAEDAARDEPQVVEAAPVAEVSSLEPGGEAEVAAEPSAAEESSIAGFASQAESRAEPAKEPPRVDAWLERRLRVFEKTLAVVEARLAAVQKESSAAATQVDENTKIFGARLDASEKRLGDLSGDLTTRMSAVEKRVREAQGELRNNLLNVSMRLDQLEAAAKRVADQSGYTRPVEIASVVAEGPAPEADATVEPETKPVTGAADTYLSAARQAAKAAAMLAEMEQAQAKTKLKLPGWVNRRNTTIAGAVALCFVIGPMAAYAVGERVGRSTPVRIVVPRSALQHKVAPLKTAALTPLDKLSALASAGNPRAELLIGLRYLKGDGAPIDKSEAAKWILKSASAHDPMGQYWAAELFQHGDGVSPDASEALRWYQAAAGQGNRQAMHDLGIAYAQGLGTQKDLDQSAQWFEKAAALGLVNSQFNLAVLYERGEGVKQSIADAYKWYAIAAAQGDAESQSRIDAIATQLKPAVLAAAKAAAATFKPATLDTDANTVALPGA
jgi:TPR repeat protein